VETHKRAAQSKSFVRRCKNAATVIGSLVVLGSFVTKEIVQEHLKSILDSLDSENQIFQIRSDNAFQQKQLTSLTVSIENVRLDEQETPKKREMLRHQLDDAIDHDKMIVKTSIERAKRSNQDVREFIKPIPNVRPLELELNNSDGQLDQLLQANDALRGNVLDNFLDDDFVGPLPNERELIESTSYLRREIAEVRDRALQSTDVSANLRDKALDASKRYRSEIEKKYQSYTLAIYILFGVGWVFGLGGRLLGFDAPNGAE
jgi:hypothetical protein